MTIHSKDLVKSREVPSSSSSQPSTRPWLNKSLVAVKEQVEYSIMYPHHLDADPDSTYYLDADPDKDPDSDLYLLRMRIHVRIRLFTLMRIGIRIQILASK
jgi:hypothetical protein